MVLVEAKQSQQFLTWLIVTKTDAALFVVFGGVRVIALLESRLRQLREHVGLCRVLVVLNELVRHSVVVYIIAVTSVDAGASDTMWISLSQCLCSVN